MFRSGVVAALMALGFFMPPLAEAADELSTSNRLEDRRFVTSGPRAYEVGTEAGRFPATGWHTRGEMGGIWSPPIKLVDGIWFGVDKRWIGPATRFTSGYGHVRMRLPGSGGLSIERTDFVPGEARGVLVGLHLQGKGRRTVKLRMQTHSELMSIYPWGETTPSQPTFNLADEARFAGRSLIFTEQGTPPVANAEPHDWAAAVGSTLRPKRARTGAALRGPQGDLICPATGDTPAEPCDDGAFGKGRGGELTYKVKLPRSGRITVWFGVAGSESGARGARAELADMLDRPGAALRAKIREREALERHTRLELPGDPLLARGIDWSKQNLADSVQESRDLEIREVNAGKSYPPAKGTLDRVRFVGAGFPDYPWMFATDGEFTAFASVALGQFEPIKEHMRSLRRASLLTNGDSGKVVHEVITDGSVYFGANADAGNTDETAKFPSAVALIWRWTGDNAFRDEMYDFAKSNMAYIYRELDQDGDGWPEGLGNVERTGMGEEKLDNTTATMRGLRDLEDLAKSKGDTATATWAGEKAAGLEAHFEGAWWIPEVPQHADSLDDPGNVQVQQRHWIGVTPMEIETVRDGRVEPGLTTGEHGNAALDVRETPCYGDDFGLYHTGAPGCDGAPAGSDPDGEKQTFTLNTSIMAVGEGNYGRLGPDQQRRFTTANRRLQLPDFDEQPGAMPEIAPSPVYGRSIDKKFTDRAMVMQAWGNYGTAWPVVHQQLGVRPDAGRGALEVVPQVPGDGQRIAGSAIRLGNAGAAAVSAWRSDKTYTTRVQVGQPISKLAIGHTLPAKADVDKVVLDGNKVATPTIRDTNRGREVTVATGAGTHTLVVTTTGS